jgi:hypothetical protein
VGFPRTGLPTSTSAPAAAARASRAVADRLASLVRRCSAHMHTTDRHRIPALIARPTGVTIRLYPLLRAPSGRLALDKPGGRGAFDPSASWRAMAHTVKNLRNVASAVVPLNFREVRTLHFCSTGVTV